MYIGGAGETGVCVYRDEYRCGIKDVCVCLHACVCMCVNGEKRGVHRE